MIVTKGPELEEIFKRSDWRQHMTETETPRVPTTEDAGSSVPSFTNLLKSLEDESNKSAEDLEDSAKNWRRLGMGLSISAAIGSGLAAAAVAVGDLADDRIRAAIVVVAITGAAFSGIAAAVGAPQQADKMLSESAQLKALARWSTLEQTRQTSQTQGSDQRVEAFYCWHDSIHGVQTPESVRQPVEDESNT